MSSRTPGQLWYDQKRKDIRWLKVRFRCASDAGFKCQDCGRGETDGVHLETHHRDRDYSKEIWDYPPENFVCCCEECHEKREEVVRKSRVVFQSIHPETAKRFLDILTGCGIPMDSMVGELCLYAALAADAAKKRAAGGEQ